MKPREIQVVWTQDLVVELRQLLRNYRLAKLPDTSSPAAVIEGLRRERELLRDTLAQVRHCLERSQPETLDCEVLDSLDRLRAICVSQAEKTDFALRTSEGAKSCEVT